MADSLIEGLLRKFGLGSGGWAEGVTRTGVRPDYGLSTVSGISENRAALDPSFRAGEATPTDIRDSLAEIVLSGAGLLPGMPGVPRSDREARASGARRRVDPGQVRQQAADLADGLARLRERDRLQQMMEWEAREPFMRELRKRQGFKSYTEQFNESDKDPH